MQPKLLRVLQEQEFERLGSARTIRVDVRIVAATNQDLSQMVQERRFRADLYYRLNVFPIHIPALRARPEDIPALVDHFVRKFAAQMDKPVTQVSAEVMEALRTHSWEGNIRELQNVIERAVIMSSGEFLQLSQGDLKPIIKSDTPLIKSDAPRGTGTLADAEREYIVKVLREVGGVVGGRNGAAARLGLPRTTLIARMQKLGIVQQRTAAAKVFTLEGAAPPSTASLT
jgi:formate hydrogenlyase transcriptional activator